MPRRSRMYLPGVPAHVVQRGNNREPCFFADEDYCYYREVLCQGLRRYGVALHAYVLMTNHVHLLMTPSQESSISRLMQHLGRQYVGYINKTYRRTGTLWEGRHKASLVAQETYLLTCHRYIEMNPVAAGMVTRPDDYRWSSYRHHALGETDALLSDHPLYLALASEQNERRMSYRDLFRTQLPDEDLHMIRQSLKYNHPLGNDRFRMRIEAALGRSVGQARRGRPVKSVDNK